MIVWTPLGILLVNQPRVTVMFKIVSAHTQNLIWGNLIHMSSASRQLPCFSPRSLCLPGKAEGKKNVTYLLEVLGDSPRYHRALPLLKLGGHSEACCFSMKSIDLGKRVKWQIPISFDPHHPRKDFFPEILTCWWGILRIPQIPRDRLYYIPSIYHPLYTHICPNTILPQT